jgi:hypothetical protein
MELLPRVNLIAPRTRAEAAVSATLLYLNFPGFRAVQNRSALARGVAEALARCCRGVSAFVVPPFPQPRAAFRLILSARNRGGAVADIRSPHPCLWACRRRSTSQAAPHPKGVKPSFAKTTLMLLLLLLLPFTKMMMS